MRQRNTCEHMPFTSHDNKCLSNPYITGNSTGRKRQHVNHIEQKSHTHTLTCHKQPGRQGETARQTDKQIWTRKSARAKQQKNRRDRQKPTPARTSARHCSRAADGRTTQTDRQPWTDAQKGTSNLAQSYIRGN